MQYHDFIGKVQHRARVGSTEEAVRATRATLEVLSKRLVGGAAKKLAAELPTEVGFYLTIHDEEARFGAQEFYEKVCKIENVDLPIATHHVRAVISVLQEAVSDPQIEKIRAQLTADYDPLFESGSEGQMS